MLNALEKLANPGRLATRLSVILAGVGLIAFVTITALLFLAVDDRFGALEIREIQANKARLETVMLTGSGSIKSKSLDYAIWTDTYNFVLVPTKKYSDNNLTVESLTTYKINGVSYHRNDGTPIFARYVDLETGEPVPQMEESLVALGRSPEVLRRIKSQDDFQFYIKTHGRLLLVSVAQIKRSDRSGKPPGYLIFAKVLQEAELTASLQLPAKIDFRNQSERAEVIVSADRVDVGLVAPGIDGKAAGVIRFAMPRDVMAEGWSFALTGSIGIAGMLVLLLVTLNFALRRSVVFPLARMKNHFTQIGGSGKLEMIGHSNRRDEIGSVETGLNEMIGQLVTLRMKDEMQSYELGKTQSAIGVMHNVGNGLSPLRVVLSRLNEELHPAAQEVVARALTELAGEDVEPVRRQKLVAFVVSAVQQQREQLGLGRDKVREAGRHLSQVLETIEQAKGGDAGKAEIEPCDINFLLQMNIPVARAAVDTSFVCDMIPFAHPFVLANRILLSQVITNLLVNAAEAVAASGRDDGQISISQVLIETEQGPMHRLTIDDNGDGFAEEAASKLFRHGFSTRADKNGGTGLHWCYNTINAMSGTLSVTSGGPGKGACATLTLAAYSSELREASRRL